MAEWEAAEAALGAAAHEPDQDRYDTLLDAAADALRDLLRTPAVDLPAFSAKLDLIVAHQAWELSGTEDCLKRLRQEAHRLAGDEAVSRPGNA